MEIEKKADELEKKYAQLSLEFSEETDIFAPFYKREGVDGKVYLPLEMVQLPFFLQAGSKKVLESRKGHKAYKLDQKLKKKGVSEAERREKAKMPALPIVAYTKEYKNWTIEAHPFWGLPDSFDGHVWDIIINVVSSTMQKAGKFYLIYTITPNEIETELIRKGLYKSRGGSNYNRIKESINRLKNTKYIFEKGSFRKDTNEYLSKEEYDFRLITNSYERGEKMVDGRFAMKFAIAIDPLVILNLRKNHFLIVMYKRRGQLKEYESIVLFDKLSYFAYQDMENESMFKCMQTGMKPYRKLSYSKICEYLGIEPKNEMEYKKSSIERQLKIYHDELLKNKVISEYIIQEKGKGYDKKFNVIYVYENSFLQDMFKILSKEDKLKERDYTPDERKKFLGFVQRQINDSELVRQLFK